MKNDRNAGARNGSPAEPVPPRPPGGRIDIAPMEIDIAKDHLGTTLSSRRHALGLRIEDVSEDIKVRADYLRALEQEEMHKLPTPQHARLFVKAYAERLGLNVAEVYALHDLCESPVKVKAAPEATAEPPGKGPSARSGVPIWIWIAGIILVVVVVIALWLLSRRGGNEESSTAGAASQATTEEDAAPVVQPTTSPHPAPAPVMTVGVRLTRDTWLRLIADDDTLQSRVARAGESIEAQAKSRVELSLGHAMGVEATMNGISLTPYLARALGPGGLVATVDSLTAWFGTTGTGEEQDSVLQQQSDTQ